MEELEACDSKRVHESVTCNSLPQDVQKCYDILSCTNNHLELELAERVASPRGRREDYDKDLRRWKSEAQELGNSEPQPRKLAFIGRTGVGKSTAINALLGAPVLSTRADGACTSVQTEIFYEDLPPSTWRASIQFIGKDEWKNTLSTLLDDLAAYRGTSGVKRGIHDDSGPAMDAWETLKEVYPHLRTLSFPPPDQDTHALLEHEAVASTLGSEKPIHGVGFDDLELQLRPYLTSYANIVEGKPPEPSVWHLVYSVRIYGAFDILASRAVSLVDVPGFGDANKTRTNRTEEYLKNAEIVVLVADIKRATDDQAMRDYFVKFLRQMIRIDGSMESLLIVLTGADVRINEDQLHYLDAKQRHVIQDMCQVIDRLGKSVEELDGSPPDLNQCDLATWKEYAERLQRKKEIASQLRTKQAAKNTYIAHQRSARVQEIFRQLYRQVYQNISKQDADKEPPPLPVFCIGSTDFNQLLEADRRNRAPLVFTNPEDTGIPQLGRHIRDFGCRKALSDIKAHIRQCTTLRADINNFFLSSREDSTPAARGNTARGVFERFKNVVEEICKDSGSRIDNSINELEKCLRIEAENAAECSLGIIELLGEDYRYQTYRALMGRVGEWRSIDLNEELVADMLEGTVSSVWHNFFNEFWKSELQSLIEAILDHYRVAIDSIKDRAKQSAGSGVAKRTQKACDAIDPEDILNTAQRGYLWAVSKMQRDFGGSFKTFLRRELEDHYMDVGSECGTGMFQRMKDMNETQFSSRNARALYAKLVDEVMLSIRLARANGDKALDKALDRLYSHIKRPLDCIQKDDQMTKVARKKMRTFLREEYNKPLAEVRIITDRCEERNAAPIEVTAIDVPMVQ